MEKYEELQIRAKSFLDKVYDKHPNDTILFVCHGWIKKVFVNIIKKGSVSEIKNIETPKNTSVSIFNIKEDKNHNIQLLNCVKHLYPSIEDCIKWYKELGTPDNIIDHVTMVNKIAGFIATELYKNGVKLNLELVDKASLVHDLDKWLCINDKTVRHGYKTEEILTKKGYPELGYYARQHRGDLIVKGYKSWEEKVIAYADKRTQDDTVVSLKKRFEYINGAYPPKCTKKREEQIKLSFELEKEIFSKLDLGPEELKNKIK